MLYGDFFIEGLTVIDRNGVREIPENLSRNDTVPLIYDRLRGNGFAVVSEDRIDYKHILTRQEVLFEEDSVFSGVDSSYDPKKQASFNNNTYFMEYSGNHRIYFKRRKFQIGCC